MDVEIDAGVVAAVADSRAEALLAGDGQAQAFVDQVRRPPYLRLGALLLDVRLMRRREHHQPSECGNEQRRKEIDERRPGIAASHERSCPDCRGDTLAP